MVKIKRLEVKHLYMRDARVYTLNTEQNPPVLDDNGWVDFSDEPIVDIIAAENENEAVKLVSQSTGYHESNLIAEEHIVSARGLVKGHPFRFEASSYDDGEKVGINILLPDQTEALVAFDPKLMKLKLYRRNLDLDSEYTEEIDL